MKQLGLENITLSFGGITALYKISAEVTRGSIHAIIGPNGAGKTSIFNCISGIYRPQEGTILFEGTQIDRMQPHRRARLGIARTFQNIELFRGMTVQDNLMLGRHCLMKAGLLAGGVFVGKAAREEVRHRRAVEEIIDLLEIQKIRKKVVGTLPYGLQKRVEVGRALALEPKLILLDEPMAGMNQEETESMARYIIDINEEMDITVLLIEHDMGVVMDIATEMTVLDFGRRIASGRPEDVRRDPQVISAYLGEAEGFFMEMNS